MKTVLNLYLVGILLVTLSCNQKSLLSDIEPFYGSLAYSDSIYKPVRQTVNERLFEAVANQEGYRFTISPGQQIKDEDSVMVMSMPTQVVVDNNEEFIYVMDTERYLINKFALSDGSLKKSITTAQKHRKPHNHQPRLQILPDGSIQICGIGYKQILQLHPSGDVKSSFSLPRGINGCVLGTVSGDQIALTTLNYDELFHVLNEKGRIKEGFGMLSNLHLRQPKGDIKIKGGHGLDFSGTIGTDGESSFIYAGSNWGGLLGFDMDGEFRFFREMIDHRPFPQLVPQNEGNESRSQLVEVQPKDFRFTVNVWEGVYYQQSIPPCNAEYCPNSFVVDAYSHENGDYLYSLQTPTNCGALFITEDHIYANCLGRGLVQYVRRSRP